MGTDSRPPHVYHSVMVEFLACMHGDLYSKCGLFVGVVKKQQQMCEITCLCWPSLRSRAVGEVTANMNRVGYDSGRY